MSWTNVRDNCDARTVAPHSYGCVIEYASDAFELGKSLIVGRRVAGQAFLNALCRHGSSNRLHCLASAENFGRFAAHVNEWSGRAKEPCWLKGDAPVWPAESACLL